VGGSLICWVAGVPCYTSAAASLTAMSQMSWMRVGGKVAGLQAWSAVPGKLKGFWNRRQWQNMMQRRQVSDDANVVVRIPVDRKLPTDPIERKAAILVSPGHSVSNFCASHAHSRDFVLPMCVNPYTRLGPCLRGCWRCGGRIMQSLLGCTHELTANSALKACTHATHACLPVL